MKFGFSDDTVTADIKLETETEDGVCGEGIPTILTPNMYHPRRALRNAIAEWLPEFARVKVAWGPIAKPQPMVAAAVPVPIIPSINTCMSLTTTTSTNTSSQNLSGTTLVASGSTQTSTTAISLVNTTQLQALAEVCSNVGGPTNDFMNPLPTPVMNSLVSETKVICNDQIPNPITPTVIPLSLSSITNNPDPTAKLPILSGTHIKLESIKSDHGLKNGSCNGHFKNTGDSPMSAVGQESISGGDISPSSLSPAEEMDCYSTPMCSPHQNKNVATGSGNSGLTEDVAMSENTSTCSGSMQVESHDVTASTNTATTVASNRMMVEPSDSAQR